MSQGIENLKKPVVILKIIELALCVVCIGICSTRLFGRSIIESQVIHGTFIGYSMVGVVLLLGYLLGTPLKKQAAMFVCAAAAVGFLTNGVLLLERYVKLKMKLPIATGSVAIVNCVVYAADVVVTYKTAE